MMRSAILFLGCLAGMLGFAAVARSQPVWQETFDNPSRPAAWLQNHAVVLQNGGGAGGSRSFASFNSESSRLAGNLAAPDQSGGGLADFYLEFSFRFKDATNAAFSLQIGGPGQDETAAAAVINLRCHLADGWATGLESAGQMSWQPVAGLKRVIPNAWYRLRIVGRAWGETNAHYDLLLSEPNAQAVTRAATNLTCFSRPGQTNSRAGHFSLRRAAVGGAGFDVDEIRAGLITPYRGTVVKSVDTKTLTGKVMCGYQGWFGTPGDGRSVSDWRHWTKHSGALADGNAKVDLWPDVSELEAAQRFPTGFKLADGRPAEVFSAFQEPTVLKHFQWMQAYGLDGVFVQRFANGLKYPPAVEHCNAVLANCRAGANRYGRAYAVMYDLSGLRAGQIEQVMDDWRALRRDMVITEDAAYLQHRGQPVVAVWGIGFNDDRAYTLAECRRLVEFFKHDPEAGGCTVMVGLPANWRELKDDAVPDPLLLEIAALADIISPWTVGRYTDPAGAARYAEKNLKPDLAWCHERGIDYLPVVFPGFSWHNMKGGPLNQIPRRHGQFLWSQFDQAKRAQVSMVYVAMFDEVDEGTAIFKCANDVPVGVKSQFLTLEGLPNDFYLKMVGAGTRLIHNQPALDPP